MSKAPDLDFLALQEALIGRYSIEREIGRGGMGIVYLARDIQLDRPIALKLLPPEYAAQSALRERFLREARTAAKLSQPNIVPIHAVEEAGDFVFFVMAYVEGGTLGQRVRERGPLPPHEAARILRDVSWALAYAHTQGVVHRDVKPDNILLEADSGRALVTDFGIAQVSDAERLTGSTEILGTAEYMSPEQASGEEVDERSDIYSLGIVGHFMLSGRLPFQGATVAATLAKHLTQPAPPLSSVAPDVPRELGQVVDRCLAKEPGQRFDDGKALAEAVANALQERREIPVPLRTFVTQNRERFRGITIWLLLFTLYSFVILPSEALRSGELLFFLFAWLFAALMGLAPFAMLGGMARQLLASGYSREDLLLALEDDLARRREELAFELSGKKIWIDRLGRGLLYGGLLAMTVGTGTAVALDLSTASTAVLVTASLLTVGGFVASLVGVPIAAMRLGSRHKLTGTRWPNFWKGRLGKLLFKAAGVGLERVGSASAAYRPTEMAIGMAADRLFEELPKDAQQSFSELPSVLRTLEVDAEKMRARVKELNKLLDNVEHDEALEQRRSAAAAPGVTDKRASLADDLRDARDAAQARLGEVLGALETIRLELLRMHAGAGNVESMTADLGSAKDLSAAIAGLLAGGREVERSLAPGGTD